GDILSPSLFFVWFILHPCVMCLSLLNFGGLGGFWGVFFAMPLATLFKAVEHAWPDEHRSS
ncbi:MAG TPA: AI-2E family transporter, partial [Pantoea sp.]|nr:AI-2E family transporter [Pantoea sp.]